MNKKQHSILAHPRRWWWPSAAAGAIAIAAIVAIPTAAGRAVPAHPAGSATLGNGHASITADATCPPAPDIRYVGVPWVPAEPTGCTSLDRWWRLVDDT